jgi:hypothetical protein
MAVLFGRGEIDSSKQHRPVDRLSDHKGIELSRRHERLVHRDEPSIGPPLQRRPQISDRPTRAAVVECASEFRKAIGLRNDQAAQPQNLWGQDHLKHPFAMAHEHVDDVGLGLRILSVEEDSVRRAKRHVADHRDEQRGLAVEMLVERLLGGLGAKGNRIHAGPGKPEVQKRRLGSQQDRVPPPFRPAGPSADPFLASGDV